VKLGGLLARRSTKILALRRDQQCPRHTTCASFAMQRSRFGTGALENPSNVTDPRFQETPSGPGGSFREGLEISETNFVGQPTPRPTSAFVAGPLQTRSQNVARVRTWWALSRRTENCCVNSFHGSAPSLARGSRRHCPLCR